MILYSEELHLLRNAVQPDGRRLTSRRNIAFNFWADNPLQLNVMVL
jgi:hypothetical protein